MLGGKRGLLENSRNLCGGAGRTSVKILGQNGARANQAPRLATSCGKKARGKRAGHRKVSR
jgi:hypothetical protein